MTPRVLWWDGRTGLAYYGGAHVAIQRSPAVGDLQIEMIDYDSDKKIAVVREIRGRLRPMTDDERILVDQLLIRMLKAMVEAVCGKGGS